MSMLPATARSIPAIVKPAHRHAYLQKNSKQARWFSQHPVLGFRGSGARRFGELEDFEEKPWEFDDFTSAGHAELEQIREARQYARIAAYEMPRLARFMKPFVPPTPEQCIRFRYTTYFGEKHPSEAKVVMEFSPLDPHLFLTDVQRAKLVKLVGPRFNPETGVIKISCEMFEEQAQNKRYLVNLLGTLLKEAWDPTDTFKDIPLDFRHYKRKWKTKPKFPEEWKIPKEERVAMKWQRLKAQQEETLQNELYKDTEASENP